MGADFSRVRLNALLDFAGVELKQGGVLLDGDANESQAILDRRLRALASDVMGRAAVSTTTPDAFKITVASGLLQIAKGRLYVDGLLAENHGARSVDPAKRVYDDLLAEPAFADPVFYSDSLPFTDPTYRGQPYFASPPPLPTSGRHLVYLDVWNREVTHLEDPDLVESAVGVETSSRVQTVWQVRVLDDDAGGTTTCQSPDGDFPGWASVIAPSDGVLSTGTFAVATVDDPCELPASGGYRGLENQLYRVEIHDGGLPGGTATFKWSRENASVGSLAASVISSKELELKSLGRDDVLRFNTGDWVEITDDVRELSRTPGVIRRITVDEATRRISFTTDLPGTMLPGMFPDSAFPAQRHLRVRRWDQQGKVYRSDISGIPVQIQDLDAIASTGLIQVPTAGVEVLLENGVTVRFDATGTTGFREGDYWVFAARTTDASVEILDRAVPRGIHHHFARLGIWDVAAGTVADCRHPWPPSCECDECGCSACVTHESHTSGQFTIQDAVNRVSQTGGTVCLGPGTFALRSPVRVRNARAVRIRGQGPSTVVVAPAGGFAFDTCLAVGIESLALLSLATASGITIQTALGLIIRDVVICLVGEGDGAGITLAGILAAASVRDSAIVAPNGIVALGAVDKSTTARTMTRSASREPVTHVETAPTRTKLASFLLTAALAIEDNLFSCQRRAVSLDGPVLQLFGTRINGNEVLGCLEVAISVLGLGAPGSSLLVRGNTCSVAGDGVRCGVDGSWIAENKLVNLAPGSGSSRATGVSLMSGLDKNGPDQCQILANQLSGFPGAGIQIGTPTSSLVIKQNLIEHCGNGIVSTDAASGGSVVIENNLLQYLGPDGEDGHAAVVGIGLRKAMTATVSNNIVRFVGVNALRAPLRAGIITIGVARLRVCGNELTGIAPPGDFIGPAAGIIIRAPFAQFDINNNHVQRDAAPSVLPSNSAWQALVALDVDPNVPVSHAGPLISVRVSGTQMMVLGGGLPFLRPVIASTQGSGATSQSAATTGPTVGTPSGPLKHVPIGSTTAAPIVTLPTITALPLPSLPRGTVLGNEFIARGGLPAVQVATRGECLFNSNHVEWHAFGAGVLGTAVALTTPIAIVNANRVRGGEVAVRVDQGRQIAMVGNITSGVLLPTPTAPWDSLNLHD